MNKKVIPLSIPNLSGNEWKYVKDCLDTGWISSVGSYVDDFEKALATYVGSKYAVAIVNGTAALHIAQLVLGVKPGDYVIMPNITFVATANSVKHAGASPIFIDADPKTWQMDLDLLEGFLKKETFLNPNGVLTHRKDNRPIRAIIPVHVQGNMINMDKFEKIIRNLNLIVIEDAAESLGSRYKKKHSGTFGKIGCFSFNGNKVISTGGGGMIVTDNESLAKKAKHITTTAKTDPLLYYHDEVGYNYRLVNVLAAIGVAQMEQLESFLKRKNDIVNYYKKHLEGVGDIEFQKIENDIDYNGWLYTIKTKQQGPLLRYLIDHKIISRPFWMPMNELPMYKSDLYITKNNNCKHIHETCLSIPCSTNITNEDLSIVVEVIKSFFKNGYNV